VRSVECIAPSVAAFTRAARFLLYFSGSTELYVTVSCDHGVSNVWNIVDCSFHSLRALFRIISLTNLLVWWWALSTCAPTFAPSERPHQSSKATYQLIDNLGIQRRPPNYVEEMCVQVSSVSTRAALRSAARGDLVIPRTRLRLGSRAFSVAGPAAWNSLPSDIRTASTPFAFKNRLKTHLFLQSYYVLSS